MTSSRAGVLLVAVLYLSPAQAQTWGTQPKPITTQVTPVKIVQVMDPSKLLQPFTCDTLLAWLKEWAPKTSNGLGLWMSAALQTPSPWIVVRGTNTLTTGPSGTLSEAYTFTATDNVSLTSGGAQFTPLMRQMGVGKSSAGVSAYYVENNVRYTSTNVECRPSQYSYFITGAMKAPNNNNQVPFVFSFTIATVN